MVRGDLSTYWVVYNPDNQATAGTCSDVLTISKLDLRDLEAIATGTRVMEYFLDVVPRHVLDFYLVVVCTHFRSRDFNTGRRWRWPKAEEISVGVTLQIT